MVICVPDHLQMCSDLKASSMCLEGIHTCTWSCPVGIGSPRTHVNARCEQGPSFPLSQNTPLSSAPSITSGSSLMPRCPARPLSSPPEPKLSEPQTFNNKQFALALRAIWVEEIASAFVFKGRGCLETHLFTSLSFFPSLSLSLSLSLSPSSL